MNTELEWIKGERKLLQVKYLNEAKLIWTSFEGLEAEKKHRKAYNQYINQDKFLEVLEAKIEANIKDLEYYKREIKGEK